MKVVVPVNLGDNKYTVETEVESLMDIAAGDIAFFQSLPKKCDHCNSGNLMLNRRIAKGFTFNSLKCATCGAELKFGQRKDGTGFFVKKDQKFIKFRAGEATEDGFEQTAPIG